MCPGVAIIILVVEKETMRERERERETESFSVVTVGWQKVEFAVVAFEIHIIVPLLYSEFVRRFESSCDFSRLRFPR